MARLPSLIENAAPSTLLGLGLSGAAVALGVYYAATSKSPQDKETKEPHHLPGSWLLLGDLPAYLANEARIHDWMAETSAAFDSEPWVLRIPGQKNLVLVTMPEAVEDVFTNQFDIFQRGAFQTEHLEAMFGHAIVNSDGKRWYHQRKAAAKFFTARSLRVCMTTVMQKNIHQLFEFLDETVASRRPIDMGELCHEFALQTFIEVGLGLDDLRWIGRDEPNPLGQSMDVASAATLRRFRVPGFYWRLLRFLNVGSEHDLAKSMGSARDWIRTVITKSIDAVQTKRAKRDAEGAGAENNDVATVLELFIEQSHENVEGMGPDDLVDFILTFVLAANDTSATSLTWFFLMLTKYPHVEAKIREEMAVVLPSLGADADTYLTTDHVQKLVYLEATIKEVLRLYPALPLLQREAMEDTVIAGNTPIRKGDIVGVSPYMTARSTRVWGPDATEFKPERWIDSTTGELLIVPSAKFNTFSSGPRICVGMKLAMMELRVATANLLHRYRFDLAVPNDATYETAIGLVLKDPLMVTATPVATK